MREAIEFLKKTEIRENLKQLPAWESGFEVPDVIGYEDVIWAAEDFSRELSTEMYALRSHRVDLFPVPKPGGGLRQIAVPQAADLALLRAAAGRILRVTDPMLPAAVFSNRLERPPPGWTFRDARRSFRLACEEARRLLLAPGIHLMCKTDVENYYPSVDLKRVNAALLDWNCDLDVVSFVINVYVRWQQRARFSGLPLGPDLSAVLGNAYLLAVDRLLGRLGVPYVRYSDDMFLFFSDRVSANAALLELDAQLNLLGLKRSIQKTHILEPGEALGAIEDSVLQYASFSLRNSANQDEELTRLFDLEIAGTRHPDRKRFRWIMRKLLEAGNPLGAQFLVDNPESMQADARLAGEYLARVGRRIQTVRDRVMEILEVPPVDEFVAIQLHLLRAASHWSWGGTEGRVFMRLATNTALPAPLRAWAWKALRRTPSWSVGLAADFVVEQDHPLARRAATTTLRGQLGGRRLLALHDRIVSSSEDAPELKYTCRWLEAA